MLVLLILFKINAYSRIVRYLLKNLGLAFLKAKDETVRNSVVRIRQFKLIQGTATIANDNSYNRTTAKITITIS